MKQKIAPYNYKRPDRISKNQLRSLHFVHDRFARNTSSAVSAFLRKIVEINLDKIDQVTYADFLKSIADPTCFSAISLKPLDGLAALEVSPEGVFSMIDRLLGGVGKPIETNRPMTEIEQKVVEGILGVLIENLREAWRQIYVIEFAVTSTEVHPHMVQVVSPNEMVVVFKFQMRTQDCTSSISLAFPTLVLEPIIHIFDKDLISAKKHTVSMTLASNVEKVPVNVTIETAETLFPMRSILSVQEGDTLVLEQKKELPVVLRIAGKEKLKATARLEASKKVFTIIETPLSEGGHPSGNHA